MPSGGFRDRLETAALFASGRHPLFTAAFFPSKNSTPAEPIPHVLRYPVFRPPYESPVEGTYESRFEKGNRKTHERLNQLEGTGEQITFDDGFIFTVPHPITGIEIVVDRKNDHMLGAIISEARERIFSHPQWSEERKMFEISLLCFGSHKLKRTPFTDISPTVSLQSDNIVPTRIYFGELLTTVHIQDFECTILAMACELVAQDCGLPFSSRSGKKAVFSSYTTCLGDHMWGILHTETPRLIDWTIYPKTLDSIFLATQHAPIKRNINAFDSYYQELWDSFLRKFGNFPVLTRSSFQLHEDDYIDYQAGLKPHLALRNESVYLTRDDQYLYSVNLPMGWSEIS